jgi:hypothetical protein
MIELSRRVGARLALHQVIIDARGGLPDKPRTSEQHVRALKWRLEHFATMLKWDFHVAEDAVPFLDDGHAAGARHI